MTSRPPAAVLVTGGGGFVASHLKKELESSGHRVTAARRSVAKPPDDDVASDVDLVLPDDERVAEVIARAMPDTVVHLAATSSPPVAEFNPSVAIRSNVEGTASVFRALDRVDPARRIAVVMASTSHVYSPPIDGEALIETSPLGPASVYGRTKLAAELVALCCSSASHRGHEPQRPARPMVIFRSFNHVGPGQSQEFVISSFARQFARVKLGKQQPLIETGNVAVARDFTDVRDVARVYRMAVDGDVPPGVYNLASGQAVGLTRILELFQETTGLSVAFCENQKLHRSAEVPVLRGCSEKLERASGWRPEIALSRTVQDVIDWWIEQEQHT